MAKQEEYLFEVEKEDSGLRLDAYLARRLSSQLSRSAIKQLISQGQVFIEEKRLKPDYRIKEGERISLNIPEESKPSLIPQPEALPLEVVYEDEDIILINKPAGMVVHPGAGNPSKTLVNALLHKSRHLSTLNLPHRPGIVHRLDKDTSGLLVVAKNNASHLHLARQFQRHSVKRIYIALVKGSLRFEAGKISFPLARHPRDRKRIAVRFLKSKEALTEYKVLKRFPEMTLLELRPKTGRTHQLRVHLSYLGHPVLGDVKYGHREGFSRLMLHAKYLGFLHPKTERYVQFDSEIPREIKRLIEKPPHQLGKEGVD